MKLGMQVSLGPGHIVLDGDPAPPPAYCGQTAGCIKMPLGMEVCLSPVDVVLDGDPAPGPQLGKGVEPSLNFRSMSIVAKRLDGSRWHLAWR